MFYHENFNALRVIIVLVLFWGVQGYPGKRSEKPAVEHNVSSLIDLTRNSDKDKSDILTRQLQIENYRSFTKKPGPLAYVNDVMSNNESDGKIIFPESSEHPHVEPGYNSSPVPTCENTTFCEDAPDYPSDLIRRAINTRDDLKYLAIVDTPTEFGQRFGDNDEPLCVAEDLVVFPKKAMNRAKQWLHIINEENFPQGVRIETCKSENGVCRIIEGLAAGYETSCKQKYVYRQLAAVAVNGSVGVDSFRLPASCCCHIKFTGNLTMRMNID